MKIIIDEKEIRNIVHDEIGNPLQNISKIMTPKKKSLSIIGYTCVRYVWHWFMH